MAFWNKRSLECSRNGALTLSASCSLVGAWRLPGYRLVFLSSGQIYRRWSGCWFAVGVVREERQQRQGAVLVVLGDTLTLWTCWIQLLSRSLHCTPRNWCVVRYWLVDVIWFSFPLGLHSSSPREHGWFLLWCCFMLMWPPLVTRPCSPHSPCDCAFEVTCIWNEGKMQSFSKIVNNYAFPLYKEQKCWNQRIRLRLVARLLTLPFLEQDRDSACKPRRNMEWRPGMPQEQHWVWQEDWTGWVTEARPYSWDCIRISQFLCNTC